MNVLSLFDGISCGMVALERANIPVEEYAAFEIDKYALQVSEKNYPNIKHYGNVFEGDFSLFKGFDLLIGGSPCTYWSIARKNRETTSDGEGFRLFMQYVRALEESECKYFLYENNNSIHRDIKDEISKKLGVEPVMINSALVSAQQRKRCYWTNIPNVTQSEDRGILLKDILQSGISWQDKSYAYTTRCQAATVKDTFERHRHTMVAEPVIIQKGHGFNKGGIKFDKCPTFTANSDFIHNNFVIEPIRVGQIGNGGDLETNTGLYAVLQSIETTEGKIYEVRNSIVKLKGKEYPIKLPDGFYAIRKLTPIEAERLQTLPDDYTAGISNTQRYKCIGNGWTVDVIAHILGGLNGN